MSKRVIKKNGKKGEKTQAIQLGPVKSLGSRCRTAIWIFIIILIINDRLGGHSGGRFYHRRTKPRSRPSASVMAQIHPLQRLKRIETKRWGLVEEAVSCELLSANSLLTGKNTGNFSEFGRKIRVESRQTIHFAREASVRGSNQNRDLIGA
jgi:hypothetical protein